MHLLDSSSSSCSSSSSSGTIIILLFSIIQLVSFISFYSPLQLLLPHLFININVFIVLVLLRLFSPLSLDYCVSCLFSGFIMFHQFFFGIFSYWKMFFQFDLIILFVSFAVLSNFYWFSICFHLLLLLL